MKRWGMLCSGLLTVLLATGCGGDGRTVVTVTVNPSAATVVVGGTFQFVSSVAGNTNQNVNWSVNGVAGGNAMVGTISMTGLYTAPATFPTPPNPRTVTVTATSQAVSTASGSAMVTIDSGITFGVTPKNLTVGTGQTLEYIATLTNTMDLNVNWSVNDIAGGNTTVGTIAPMTCTTPGSNTSCALYTAPAMVPTTATQTVKGVSAFDSTRMDTAPVILAATNAPTLASINPSMIAQGATTTDVYLTGTEFLSTSTVRLNGTPTPATFHSQTLLRLQLTEAQLGSAGTFAVDVAQQGGMLVSGTQNLNIDPVRPALIGPSPDSVQQNSGVLNVRFNGGYYSTSVSAEFDGSVRTATLNNNRQLDVTLTVGDSSTAGLFPIAVRNSTAAQQVAVTNLAIQPNVAPSVTATIAVGMMPSAVGVNTATGMAVVANRGDNTVSLIDLGTNSTVGSPIAVGMAPTGVAVDNERNLAIVANNGSNDFHIVDIDPASPTFGTVTATFASPTPMGATAPLKPVSVAVNPLTGLALVANESTNLATVIDLKTLMPMAPPTITTVSASTGANPRVDIHPRLNWGFITPGGGGTLTIVELSGQTAMATVLVGLNVRGVAINPEAERALFTDHTTATAPLMSVLDQAITSAPLGGTGHVAAAVNPLTNVGVAVNSNGTATVVDLFAPQPTPLASGIMVGTNPVAVAIDPGSNTAVVANEGSNNVTVLSLGPIRSLHLTQVSTPVGAGPAPATTFTSTTDVPITVTGFGFASGSAVRLDGTAIATSFVSSRRLTAMVPAMLLMGPRRYAVDVLNPSAPFTSNVAELMVIQPVPLATTAMNCMTSGPVPRGVAIDPERDLAIVTKTCADEVDLVDLNTGMVTATVAVGTNPQGVAVYSRGARAVVVNRGSDNVSVLDLDPASMTFGTVVASPAVGDEPVGVGVDATTGLALVANAASNTVTTINLAAAMPVAGTSVSVDLRPETVAVDPIRNRFAVTSAGLNTVMILSTSGGAPALALRVSGFGLQLPTGVAFDSAADRFVAVSSLSNEIFVIQPDTGQFTRNRVGINPTSVAANPNSSTLVSVNRASRTISLMDFQERRVRGVLPIAASPQLALDIHPRSNVAAIVDEAGNRLLLVQLPR